MPTISMFFGIVIYLYAYDNKKHKKPHIHAAYQNSHAVFSIDTHEIIGGRFPKNKTRLVQAWMEIHREDLIADWFLAVNGHNPNPIKPLE